MSAGKRLLIVGLGLIGIWQVVVWVAQTPPYILPGPGLVLIALIKNAELIFRNSLITFTEIVAGLVIGLMLGLSLALTMVNFRPARSWLLPVLVISQALPVFALAPLLVLWFGYGMASKIAMAVLIIFFPVTAACYDGLRHANPGWIDLAHTLGASPTAILRHIRLPASLPALASGLRIATAVAPIGAVVGEWVGSSGGLGYLMLHANARMQVDLMFAALLVLAVFALVLYFFIDYCLSRLLHWQPESMNAGTRNQSLANI